ncbi:PREDICTED: uncharacterized protein LOC108381947 [Rhagoletis zephyria]|uniref:uncharacterized protein LOC108381947 n=1 Tax=Rhagoletis zephyria TaxID=28612 RepID=UPI00081179D6|nr:PREDICTED: uncharacterized protein LOC108381947 [Rhagoletis zephyria]
MNKFLTCRYEVVERLGTYRPTKPKPQFTPFNPRAGSHSSTFINKNRTQSFHVDSAKPVSCKLCNSNHAMKLCVRFKNLSVPDRLKFVREHKYCENCLSCSHLKGQCQSKFTCVYCQQRHHSLLHFQANQQNSKPNPKPQSSTTQATTTVEIADDMPSTSTGNHNSKHK